MPALRCFSLDGTLGSDPEFRPGRREARLRIYGPADEATKVRVARATLGMKWDRERIRLPAEAEVPQGGKSPVAAGFAGDGREKGEGAVAATVRVGPFASEVTLPVRMKASHRSARSGDAVGEVVTVEVSGEMKTSR